jgi:hypothetical protein
MKIMKQKSDRCFIQHPFNDTHTTQWITGFVDNITHWYAAPNKQEPMETIISKMEQAAQWWEQLLSTTGGKLELSKCFFYLMYWTFDNEGVAHPIHPTELNRNITLIDSETKKNVTIKALATSESHKTLGVMESGRELH